MSDNSGAASATEMLRLPSVALLRGAKRSAFFAKASAIRVGPVAIAEIPDGVIFPDGRVTTSDHADHDLEDSAELSIYAIPAGQSVCLGAFVAGPLNEILGVRPQPPLGGIALSARQMDVLARLGRLRDYVTISSPRRFRRIMAASLGQYCLPGSTLRGIADQLRAPKAESGARIAILPIRQFERFCLTNRASLTAWLRARHFTILEPETARLPDTLERLAAASLVLLADPRQAGLLGLCHPGTRVIEIAPEGWLSATAHYYCTVFGLDWRPFLASPPCYPLRGALPFGSLVPCSYEVSIRDLAGAMDTFAGM